MASEQYHVCTLPEGKSLSSNGASINRVQISMVNGDLKSTDLYLGISCRGIHHFSTETKQLRCMHTMSASVVFTSNLIAVLDETNKTTSIYTGTSSDQGSYAINVHTFDSRGSLASSVSLSIDQQVNLLGYSGGKLIAQLEDLSLLDIEVDGLLEKGRLGLQHRIRDAYGISDTAIRQLSFPALGTLRLSQHDSHEANFTSKHQDILLSPAMIPSKDASGTEMIDGIIRPNGHTIIAYKSRNSIMLVDYDVDGVVEQADTVENNIGTLGKIGVKSCGMEVITIQLGRTIIIWNTAYHFQAARFTIPEHSEHLVTIHNRQTGELIILVIEDSALSYISFSSLPQRQLSSLIGIGLPKSTIGKEDQTMIANPDEPSWLADGLNGSSLSTTKSAGDVQLSVKRKGQQQTGTKQDEHDLTVFDTASHPLDLTSTLNGFAKFTSDGINLESQDNLVHRDDHTHWGGITPLTLCTSYEQTEHPAPDFLFRQLLILIRTFDQSLITQALRSLATDTRTALLDLVIEELEKIVAGIHQESDLAYEAMYILASCLLDTCGTTHFILGAESTATINDMRAILDTLLSRTSIIQEQTGLLGNFLLKHQSKAFTAQSPSSKRTGVGHSGGGKISVRAAAQKRFNEIGSSYTIDTLTI